MKLKEVRKQKEEQEQKHAEEIEALMDDGEHQSQQALVLAANNASLRSELDRSHKTIERLEQNFQNLLKKNTRLMSLQLQQFSSVTHRSYFATILSVLTL